MRGKPTRAPVLEKVILLRLRRGNRPSDIPGDSNVGLTGWEHLGESSSLRVLALDRVGDVPTFGWMRGLKTLETLSVLGANLVDRDLSPLFDLPALSQLRLELKGMKEGTHFANTAEELFAIADAHAAAKLADEGLRGHSLEAVIKSAGPDVIAKVEGTELRLDNVVLRIENQRIVGVDVAETCR